MIVVLNPNSSTEVTTAIEEACLESGIAPDRWRVERLADGPTVIETDEEAAIAARMVTEYVRGTDAECVIIACHGDPGLEQAREANPRCRVIGIGETSMSIASTMTGGFGVISLEEPAVARKWRMVRRLGLDRNCASIVASGTGVLHGVEENLEPAPYVAAAQKAMTEGADVLVLGCAGMTRLPKLISDHVGIPVIEPVVATLAVAALQDGSGT